MRAATELMVTLNPRLSSPHMEVMNFLNEATARYPEAISLAAGRPPDQFVPAEQTAGWIQRFVTARAAQQRREPRDVWSELGQYGATNGFTRDIVAAYLARDEQLSIDPQAIMVTNGMQEALLLLLLGAFEAPRDVLLTDDPTYTGLTGAAALAGIEVYPIPRRHGLLPGVRRAIDVLAARGQRARGLYLVPDFSNPGGETLSSVERTALLELAGRSSLLVIEDTAYRAFRYEGQQLPSLKKLDPSRCVVQIGSFSKLFMPGVRMGFLVADQGVEQQAAGEPLANLLSRAKGFCSVLTSPLVQAVVGGFLLERDFSLEGWNREKVAYCRRNRDTLWRALETEFGDDPSLRGRISWSRPEGGFFLSVTLPFPFGMQDMVACAVEHQVIVCPMECFSLSGGCERLVRLSFSNTDPERIAEGIARFARYVRHRSARSTDG